MKKRLTEKYTNDKNDLDKTLLSKDAYAICELLEALIDKIENKRL